MEQSSNDVRCGVVGVKAAMMCAPKPRQCASLALQSTLQAYPRWHSSRYALVEKLTHVTWGFGKPRLNI